METTSVDQKVWTILEVISASRAHLESKGIQDARLNAELLLAHLLHCRRIDLYANFDKPLQEREREQYKALLKRRVAREPLQYIIGDAEFMGLTFKVDRRVLVPRPDTELLVEKAIELCRQYPEGTERIRILDIGTGCGNIAVSIAKFVGNTSVTAIDSSAEALDVAKENVDLHDLAGRVSLKRVDILQESMAETGDSFDLVVSNPPYISAKEFVHLSPEIRDYEPRMATCDEKDGLAFFRRISEVGTRLLRKGGALLFEVGFGQSESVRTILDKSGYASIEIFKDYNGIERVLKGVLD
jgi:release factor glutamine methyltransferase